MKIQPLLDALDNKGRRWRKVGATAYMAQCPAHNDNRPSLSIGLKDNKILLNCFADCDSDNIIQQLDLTWADLKETTDNQVVVDMRQYLLNNARETINEHPAGTNTDIIEYIYTDIIGNPLYKTTKTVRDGKKTFRQSRYIEGQWIPGLNGETPPLYNLPLIQLAIEYNIPVAICEGEKDADTINNLGIDIIATTAPMGAGKWREQHTQQLEHINTIYIIHDNDEPGINHAITIKEALTQPGKTIHILTPAEGKDATDHINAGLTWHDFINAEQRIAEQIEARRETRIKQLIEEEIEKQTARNEAKRLIADTNAANRYQLPESRNLTQELQTPDEETPFIIDQLWPQGANISLTATYKAGKTSTINNIIKALADNQPLFGHYQCHHTGRIAYWNYEVSANQMRAWLREVGIINTDNIELLNMRGHTWPMISEYVINKTIQWLKNHNITTWIIDPLARAFVGSGDENSNENVGVFLDTLDYIKDQAGVTNLLIAAHTGRNAEQGNNRARGASRFDDWVDARWMITKDNEGQRWFTADGRDVQQDESRLDWNPETRQQTIAIGINKTQNKLETVSDRVYQIIANTGATGIHRAAIIATYKAAYGEESLSSESAETGILGNLKDRGLVYIDKVGNSKIFKITNNQTRFDLT